MQLGRIKWFKAQKGFGFFFLNNGSEIFFHIHDGKPFMDDGTDVPAFDYTWGAVVQTPTYEDIGTEVYFETAPGRGGRAKACPWGYVKSFQSAILAIKNRKEEEAYREAERLRCNPCFRAFEERVYLDGRTEARRGIYIGTKAKFLLNFPLGHKYDPLTSTKFNGVDWRYERWFERESTDGWINCEDPRTTKLPLTFEQARMLLAGADFDCLKDYAFGDTEFGWTKDEKPIASGYDSRRGCEVWIAETGLYAATEFKGKQAQVLYNAGGKTNHSERNDAGDPREW